MATYNYAEKFLPTIQEKYRTELKSDFLTHSNPQVQFMNAQTIKVPELSLGGYGNHNRATLGFNSSEATNTWTPYKLAWDRDVEIFIDPMDVDETNLVTSIAHLQNTFEEDVAIPEKDKYRFSKLVKEATEKGSTIDNDALTTENILAKFDAYMEAMDEAGVKSDRKLVVTPKVYTMLKQAEGVQRYLEVSGAKNINRMVHSLDDVEIIKVPSDRLKTAYEDQGTGVEKAYVATASATQINMILVEPSAIICRDKYAYIRVFTPGSDTRAADAYVYQNRYYSDLFVIKTKSAGVIANVERAKTTGSSDTGK